MYESEWLVPESSSECATILESDVAISNKVEDMPILHQNSTSRNSHRCSQRGEDKYIHSNIV